ncbi:MAG: cytochrome c biogenesis protein CcsA [Candidatus Omnitrophica bacterium]|nr:cytochrome c biogenesis protein CcsA [Candidatus Omnitrophota bacterium]
MRRVVKIMLCAAGFAGLAAFGQGWAQTSGVPKTALNALRRIAVQHNGRVKPLDSFARETLQQITGNPRFQQQDPVETILLMMADSEPWQAKALVSVPFGPLREPLGMDRHAKAISYNDLVASRKLMRMLPAISQKQQRSEKLTIQEEETMDVFGRFVAVSGVFEQKLHLAPPPAASLDVEWRAPQQLEGYPEPQAEAIRASWTTVLGAIRAGRQETIITAAQQAAAALQQANPAAYPAAWRLTLEVFYNHAQPFHLAQLLYLMAFVLLARVIASERRKRSARIGLIMYAAAMLLHGAGIAMRVILGGRPPVSNFYETMLWLPFVLVVTAFIFERIYRANLFALAASILAAATLMLADFVPLDSSISPVVAVLHSNLWLTIHVLTIVGSYGALALAVGLAHIYAWLSLSRKRARSEIFAKLDLFLYRSLQVGVVTLAAGIMLGAVWANASWGRYWGWDPKETWALITLLWYVAVLHGRMAGWLHGIWVALATITGFFLLLMTYYGVSFYLVGLHSYAGGHAKPLPLLLIIYMAAEVAFLALVGAAATRRRTS